MLFKTVPNGTFLAEIDSKMAEATAVKPARLDHKVLDDAVEDHTVVKTVFDVPHEIRDRNGRHVGIELQADRIPIRELQLHEGIALVPNAERSRGVSILPFGDRCRRIRRRAPGESADRGDG